MDGKDSMRSVARSAVVSRSPSDFTPYWLLLWLVCADILDRALKGWALVERGIDGSRTMEVNVQRA